MISARHMLGGSWACSLRKFLKKKCNLVRFDVSLYTILGPPRQVPSHAICGPTQVRFLAYYMGAPSDQFLHLLYLGPQITFFAYYIGPLRSVSSHTIWGPLSDQFHCLLYGTPPPPHQISFFACYMLSLQISFCAYFLGAPLRSVYSLTIWGPSQISFFSYYMEPTKISFFAYYMGGSSDQFLRLLYGGPLRSVSSLTI